MKSTKDASSNFFIENSLPMTHKSNFSNGIITIQRCYVPEFTSYSEGIRVAVSE